MKFAGKKGTYLGAHGRRGLVCEPVISITYFSKESQLECAKRDFVPTYSFLPAASNVSKFPFKE